MIDPTKFYDVDENGNDIYSTEERRAAIAQMSMPDLIRAEMALNNWLIRELEKADAERDEARCVALVEFSRDIAHRRARPEPPANRE